MASRREDRYPITRITLTIPKPYDTVLSRLQSSIKGFDDKDLNVPSRLDDVQAFENFRSLQGRAASVYAILAH